MVLTIPCTLGADFDYSISQIGFNLTFILLVRTYLIPHIDAKKGTGLKKSTPPPVVAVVTNMNYAYVCTYDQGEINCGASWEPDFNSESFPPKASGICSTFLSIVVNAVNQAS